MANMAEMEDSSHGLDLVPFFSSTNHDAEMEALTIHSILEANGIPSVLVGTPQLPSLEFQVRVPRAHLEEAEKVVAEAKELGPKAALEAEEASENG
jgi:hypothetical protein